MFRICPIVNKICSFCGKLDDELYCGEGYQQKVKGRYKHNINKISEMDHCPFGKEGYKIGKAKR